MVIKKTINPIYVFLGVWFIDLILLTGDISYLYDGLHEEFAVEIIFVLGCFVLGYFLVALSHRIKIQGNTIQPAIDIHNLRRITYKLIMLWIVLTIVEIIASGGLPFYWYLIGNGKTYFDFGINGLHGFCNAVYFIILCNIFMVKKCIRSKKLTYGLLILFLWPILVVSRQVFLVAVMNLFFLFCVTTRVSIKIVIKSLIIVFLLIIGFGYLGDFRTGHDKFIELAQPKYDWLTELPSGFLWGLIYFTSPIANLQIVFENAVPTNEPYLTLGKVLPSPLRNVVFESAESADVMSDNLITAAFNVSSYMADFYIDGGFVYLILFTFVLGGMSRYIYMKMISRCSYFFLIAYSLLCQMHFFSVFYNHYMYLPVMFTIIIAWVVNRRVSNYGVK